jgi:solute:Na+ symporter, SSS family
VGAMLFAFYHLFLPSVAFGKTDRIFPTFIVTQMPHGISGLLIAAILAAAMSNLSAALNSLSSSSIVDFYSRRHPEASEETRVRLSRAATVIWGLILFLLAILSRRGGRVVEVGLSIASVAFGALLGVFLLGVLTKRANERGTIVGMLAGFLTSLYIWEGRSVLEWLQATTSIHWTALALPRVIPFTWYVMIGSLVTFLVGYAASIGLQSNHNDAEPVAIAAERARP